MTTTARPPLAQRSRDAFAAYQWAESDRRLREESDRRLRQDAEARAWAASTMRERFDEDVALDAFEQTIDGTYTVAVGGVRLECNYFWRTVHLTALYDGCTHVWTSRNVLTELDLGAEQDRYEGKRADCPTCRHGLRDSA